MLSVEAMSSVVAPAVAKNEKSSASNKTEEPEEVTANSMEIQKLREMHEQMTESYSRKSKRRKVSTIAKEPAAAIADVQLDQSIFDTFDQPSGDNGNAEDSDEDEHSRLGWKIDTRRSNSRKM